MWHDKPLIVGMIICTPWKFNIDLSIVFVGATTLVLKNHIGMMGRLIDPGHSKPTSATIIIDG